MTKPVDMREEAQRRMRKMARRAESQGTAPEGNEAEAGIAAKEITPDAVQRWAQQLNVPASRLRQAIWRVGPRVEDVKRFLASAPQH
jgi:hypothetical protein